MQPTNYATCAEKPVIARNAEGRAITIHRKCGSFLWSPFDNGDTGDRSLDELEAEAIFNSNAALPATR